MKTKFLFAPAILITIATACGSSSSGSSSNGQVGSISLSLSGGNFSGNSVRICGSRTPPADGKFRCENSLSSPDAGPEGCPCFNFTADGNLVDPVTGEPVVIRNLCPSSDLAADGSAGADWTFTFSLFTSPDCMGAQLNTPDNNLACFDSRDLATQAHPNESVETLSPGLNQNHVICTTVNASKTFNFLSCAVGTTPADMAAGQNRFECGCTPVSEGTCSCGDGGPGPGDLEAGCFFDPATCDILCAASADAGVPDAGVPDTGAPDAEVDAGADAAPECPVNPVDGNNGFLVVVSGNATVTSNENEGTMALGGNLTLGGTYNLANSGAGSFVVDGDAHATAMVVGGRIDLAASQPTAILNVLSSGYIKVGDLTGVNVRDTDNNGAQVNTRVVPGADYDATPRVGLTVQQPVASVGPASVMDFTALFATYAQRSAGLATCASTVVLTDANGTALAEPVPPGTDAFVRLTPGITNVVNISSTDLNNIATLTFPTAPTASTPLLINVSTASVGGVFTWTPPNFAGIAGAQGQFVLLNFPDAKQITQVNGGSVEGTIFAPGAQFTDLSASNNEGNIVVAGYQQGADGMNGGEVHVFPFATTLSCQCN